MIGIYKITNNITNKIYIGQSGRVEGRLGNHKRQAYDINHKQYDWELYQDIRKYGEDNFTFEIVETIDITDIEEKWIQKFVKEGYEMYNKNLKPKTNSQGHLKKFNNSEIANIIKLLKENKISNIKIAKQFNCSPSLIDDINNGKKYKQENESYPIRDYKAIGSNNHNALYTDEEVIKIREEYVNNSIGTLFKKYGKNKNQDVFSRMVRGKTYNHLPIYNKDTQSWTNQ